MEQRLARFVVYAITLGILYVVIGLVSSRGIPSETNRSQYVVKMPGALKAVYLALFLMGILLFLVFLFFKLKGNPSITNGNFRMALIISGIGLFVMIYASRWKIVVDHGELKFFRMFRKTVEVRIGDLDTVQIGSKSQLILSKEGKKLAVVDVLCDNSELLEEDLKSNGKLP